MDPSRSLSRPIPPKHRGKATYPLREQLFRSPNSRHPRNLHLHCHTAADSCQAANNSGTLQVTASFADCKWTATSNAPWIFLASSGTGNGTVQYAIASNTGPQRTGTIAISGSIATIIQEPTGTTGIPSALSSISGDGQTGAPGAALTQPLLVKLTAADGSSFPGASVTFAATSGAATLNPGTATTASDGTASTSVTLGNKPGPITITATAAGLPSVAFTVNAITPAPQILPNGVVGAGLSTPTIQTVSPNAILSIFGQNLAPAGTNASSPSLSTNLGGTCVLFGAARAPLFLVTPVQLNVQVPQLPATSGSIPVQVDHQLRPAKLAILERSHAASASVIPRILLLGA